MWFTLSFRRAVARVGVCALLAGCAALPPMGAPGRIGQTGAEVTARHGAPTGVHVLPGGQRRLEYATGPEGRQTWMLDLDAAGRVAAVTQVLDERALAAAQASLPGLDTAALLRTLGRPGERRGVARPPGAKVWSWRYPTHDCLWFEVTLGADGRVRDAGFGPDWRCQARSDARSE